MAHQRRYLQLLAHGQRKFRQFWASNSGDWHWLASKPASIASINRILWRESVPSLSFFMMMLTLSGIISTLGLLAGSTATVIGAMIIAPLMGPIIGIAYAITVANRRLMKRAGITLIFATALTVFCAFLLCQLTGMRSLTEEIALRTEPTLIDLFIAVAAGAAGAFAKSRKHIADAFPGVAIAVALVPPLSAIGIGIALSNPAVWQRATLLFMTNLLGIIFSGSVVFLWQGYGSVERAQGGMLLSLVMLLILGIPLGISLNNLLVQANTRQQIWHLARHEMTPLDASELQSLKIFRKQDGTLEVDMHLVAPIDTISDTQVQQSQVFLEKELQRPINLTIQVTPVREFRALSAKP